MTGRLLIWFRAPFQTWYSAERSDAGPVQKESHFHPHKASLPDPRVILFGRGRHRIFLLNTMFGKGHVRELSGERDSSGLWFWEGAMESNVGILLTSQDFGNCLSPRLLQQVRPFHEEKEGLPPARASVKGDSSLYPAGAFKAASGYAKRSGGAIRLWTICLPSRIIPSASTVA